MTPRHVSYLLQLKRLKSGHLFGATINLASSFCLPPATPAPSTCCDCTPRLRKRKEEISLVTIPQSCRPTPLAPPAASHHASAACGHPSHPRPPYASPVVARASAETTFSAVELAQHPDRGNHTVSRWQRPHNVPRLPRSLQCAFEDSRKCRCHLLSRRLARRGALRGGLE